MDDVTQKREKFFKNVRYGSVGILAVLLVPLIFFLSMMAAGAMAAAWIAVVGGLALNYSIDPISRKLANWRIKEIKAEARKNPIETMENEALDMAGQIEKFKEALTSRKSQGAAWLAEIEELRSEDPEGAAVYDQEIKDYETEMTTRDEQLAQAVIDLEDFREVIKKAARRWKVAQMSDEFRAANMSEREQYMRKIVIDEALTAVKDRAHEATARLNVEALVNRARSQHKAAKKPATALTNNPSPALEVIVDVREKQGSNN